MRGRVAGAGFLVRSKGHQWKVLPVHRVLEIVDLRKARARELRLIPGPVAAQGTHQAVHAAAHCLIPAPLPVVWRVLTDYDRLSEFVPFLTESRLVRVVDGAKIVHQNGRGGLWIFRRRFTVTFRIEEHPTTSLTFKAIEGDFRQFEGFWRLEARPEGTLVSHQVDIEPAFYLPKWATRVLAKHLMLKSFEGVVRRCLREA